MAAPPTTKEPPMAFMTSSNDAIPLPDGVRLRNPSDSESTSQNLFSHESAVLSPFPESRGEEGQYSPTDMSSITLPKRQQVPSASQLPDTDNGVSPLDQEYWYNQYTQCKALVHTMHELWKSDSEGLQKKIATLEEALKERNDSGVGHSVKENDPAYGGPEIVKASKEKLRSLSNASFTNPADRGSIAGATNRKSSSEGSAPPLYIPPQPTNPTVGFAIGSASLASIPEIGLSVDDPPSPPTTTKIPTPPNLRAYAGHTPRGLPLAIDERANGDVNAALVRPGQYDGLDDDPALKEPRILPSKPKESAELDSLQAKLADVAADPELSVPAALRSEGTSPVASGSARSPPVVSEAAPHEINGVKLKTKRSTNFGAPFFQRPNIQPRSPDQEHL